jgi:hypothetical protein
VLYLAETLFAKKPEAYLLAIEGENWDLGECLSEMAEKYFREASAFFILQIQSLQNNIQPIQMQSFAHT